jgi:ABC-2 type transport system permease protein
VINPILERELKTRMRTVKTSMLLMVYLLIMSLIVVVFFLTNQNNFNPKVAVSIYHVIATAQFIILMMMLPAISAVSISGERERQTLDLMLCTDISPWKIIFGKIFS